MHLCPGQTIVPGSEIFHRKKRVSGIKLNGKILTRARRKHAAHKPQKCPGQDFLQKHRKKIKIFHQKTGKIKPYGEYINRSKIFSGG